MRILFVYSGNTKNMVSAVVGNQMESLKKEGLNIDGFPIVGHGVVGYLSNVKKLREFLRKNKYDLIHSHYSLSGFIAGLSTFNTPVIVSLMGSDSNMNWLFKLITRIFSEWIWDFTIIKSSQMSNQLAMKKIAVVPNGVDLEVFTPVNRLKACEILGFNPQKLNIVFPSNPIRPEKNFTLAKNAVELLEFKNFDFHSTFNLERENVIYLLSAADVILVSSIWEGSPNIVKEAMACGVPVVSTDVGDVKWLFGEVPGYFIAESNPLDFAKKIEEAIHFVLKEKRTGGIKRIIELGLDSTSVAKSIEKIYEKIVCKS